MKSQQPLPPSPGLRYIFAESINFITTTVKCFLLLAKIRKHYGIVIYSGENIVGLKTINPLFNLSNLSPHFSCHLAKGILVFPVGVLGPLLVIS